jgi:hypothetical protein
MDFMMVDFGCHDSSGLQTPSTEQQIHIGQSSSESLGMLDSNSSKGELEEAQSPFRDAMGFCADLVESCQSFITPDDSPPAYEASAKLAEQSIQNALDKTSRFLEILECLVAADAAPCRRCSTHQRATDSPTAVTGSHQQRQAAEAFASSRPPSNSSLRCHSATDSMDRSVSCVSVQHEAYDVVLITTLVTSYVYLVRVWRYVVTLLHQLLLATGPSELRGLLLLPSLQLGGFRLINNPSIQIQVLFELRSDMFQRIELMLGVGQDGAEGRYAEGKEKGRQAISISPFAASIRETLLYQEKMRTAAKHGMGDFSLKDITSKVKMQLEAQGV